MKMQTHKSTKLRAVLLLAGALAGVGFNAAAATVAWTNAVGDRLWSTAINWDVNLAPGTADDALFTDTNGFAATLGDINNIVDANTTVVNLRYRALSNGVQSHFHTTWIQPDVTLTLDSPAPSLLTDLNVGAAAGVATADSLAYVKIIGTNGGMLAVGNLAVPQHNTVGNGPAIYINNPAGHGASALSVLDLSELDTLTFGGSYVQIAGWG